MPTNEAKTGRFFAHVFFILWGCLSSASVLAAASASADLTSLPWLQIALGAGLSLFGGVTRTAEKALEFAYTPLDKRDKKTFLLSRELMKDVIVSAGIGFLIFGFGASRKWVSGRWGLHCTLGAMRERAC